MSEVRVCYPFVGDSVGGAQQSARLLIQNLPAPFCPVVVVHQCGPLTELLGQIGISYQVLPLSGYVGVGRGSGEHAIAIARAVPKIVQFLRRERISLVHGQDSRVNLTWVLPARSVGINYVWHQRSLPSNSRLSHTLAGFANAVVCNSQIAAEAMRVPRSGVLEVVDNPFDSPAQTESAVDSAREACKGRNKLLVGFVGNLTRQKRPEIFLKAAQYIAMRVPQPISFAILGADREGLQGELRECAKRLGIDRQVQFLGFRHPVEPWLEAFDLLLAPEVGDAFGRTLVEAMLAGTPVVASDSGGHLEILDHGVTGLLVPADEPKAMAAAAATILEDSMLAGRLREAARAAARSRYSTVTHARNIVALYAKLLVMPPDGAVRS